MTDIAGPIWATRLDEFRTFLELRAGRNGLDPEIIYGLGTDEGIVSVRTSTLERLLRLADAIDEAQVQRDPRHRVSMLVNDWTRIDEARAALDESV